ncbi:hypothetical protein E2C01_057953 [Portunus trituberculatus]|uniref:Uncharacterized protein n=1 Tax=Portunus trituberculatus TaxID=210409 RepID=A0A5B7H3D2_PORTR|nr:hypothetical protein [Portunus trituberculatus]
MNNEEYKTSTYRETNTCAKDEGRLCIDWWSFSTLRGQRGMVEPCWWSPWWRSGLSYYPSRGTDIDFGLGQKGGCYVESAEDLWEDGSGFVDE